jgi:hypothetical protein
MGPFAAGAGVSRGPVAQHRESQSGPHCDAGLTVSSLHGAHNRRRSGRSVRSLLAGGSSPEQIAGRLQRADPDHMGRHVSTEPIYAAR